MEIYSRIFGEHLSFFVVTAELNISNIVKVADTVIVYKAVTACFPIWDVESVDFSKGNVSGESVIETELTVGGYISGNCEVVSDWVDSEWY